jgi:antitoxin ParD1/3/4
VGEVRRVNIELTDDMAGSIERAIECGDYADLQDVVGEALDDWRMKRAAENDHLRELIEEGLNSGEPEEITDEFWERIKRRGLERLRQHRDGA